MGKQIEISRRRMNDGSWKCNNYNEDILRMGSSGILRRVALVRIYISEELSSLGISSQRASVVS
jgi:hypothetical protein